MPCGKLAGSVVLLARREVRDMNLVDAIVQVLTEADGPLHKRDIAERVLRQDLWQTSGKKTETSVGARLYENIKKKGSESLFEKIGPGVFSLKKKKPTEDRKATPNHGDSFQGASANTRNSFTSCAEMVLERFAGKQPMHYRDITKKALEQGWLATKSKKPEATMKTVILTEIRRQKERGEQPRFSQKGKGLVTLSKWVKPGLTASIEQHNERVRKELYDRLLAMTPSEFEELVSTLLTHMGFDSIEVTRTSGDGGIDVRGVLIVADSIRIKMAVQAKRWSPRKNVQTPTVQQVRGSLGAHEQGLIITTSDFSAGARQEAVQPNKTPIALVNGEKLVSLLMEHSIGVQRTTQCLFEIDDELFLSKSQTNS